MFSKICLLNSYLRAGRRPGRALSPSSLTAPSGSACTHCIAQIPYTCSLKAPTHFIHPTASCCPPSTSTHTARWPGRTWALCKTKKQNLLTSGRGRAHGGRTFPFQQTALMTWSVVWTQLRLWLDLCSPEIFIYAIASSLKRNPTTPFCKDMSLIDALTGHVWDSKCPSPLLLGLLRNTSCKRVPNSYLPCNSTTLTCYLPAHRKRSKIWTALWQWPPMIIFHTAPVTTSAIRVTQSCITTRNHEGYSTVRFTTYSKE